MKVIPVVNENDPVATTELRLGITTPCRHRSPL